MPPSTMRTGNGGIIRRWEGVVTAEDHLTAVDDFADPVWVGELRYLIMDYGGVTEFELQHHDVRSLAERAPTLWLGTRIAIIAPGDLIFGFARMWELSLGDHHPKARKVARSTEAMFAWLRIELPQVDFAEAEALLARFDPPPPAFR